MSRRLIWLVAIAGCVPRSTDDPARRYLDDAAYRRAELVASLVNPANGYSRLRLDRYTAWERLPEWNPPVSPVTRGARTPAHPLAISDAARRGDRDALVELGRAAYVAYPVQALPPGASADPRYGLWSDGDRIGGLVHVEIAGGSSQLAYTCSTCHAVVRDGQVVLGPGNSALDLGRLLGDARHRSDPALLAWGPGRADVSTTAGTQPVRFPDLRPTRYQTHLQVNATVEQRGIASLALRIETLLVTGHAELLRPPREVALGLALYLWSLAPPPPRAAVTDAELRGRSVFDVECSRCHVPPSFAGPPVALDESGRDAVGMSADRGTGRWRVPSLRGVAERGALLHDGAVSTLDALLDPARGANQHRFGLELDPSARADLVAYLRTL